MARGGNRTPANPAPVSTPGSGARTDGGAGSKTQPLRDMPADKHGERQAMMQLQGAAPMTAQGGSGISAQRPVSVDDPFRPTERPNEGPMPGMPPSSVPADMMGILPPDPQQVLREMYNLYPHPAIARLIRAR